MLKEKIKYVVLEIVRKQEPWMVDLLNQSSFIYNDHWNQKSFPNAFNLKVLIQPDKFIHYSNFISKAEKVLKSIINQATDLIIDNLELKPDYDKVVILESVVQVIKTEWEEIDEGQETLIKLMNSSSSSLEFQNIGNTARSIMDKLARIVFKHNTHKPSDLSIEVHNGKFKNQLQSYFSFELKGSKNKELRNFAKSAIEYTEKSIDLMNKTTHLLGAEKHYAEVCLTSTIGVISLVKAIEQSKN